MLAGLSLHINCSAQTLIINSSGCRWIISSGSMRSQRSRVGRSSRLITSRSPAAHLACSQIKVAGCQGMMQGFINQSMLFEPG